MRRKFHAPLWSSGRRGDPSTDCNRLNLTIRQHIAAVGRRVSTLCKGEDGLRKQLAVFHCYYNSPLWRSAGRRRGSEAILLDTTDDSYHSFRFMVVYV